MERTKGEWLLQEPGLYSNRRRVNISETNNPENDLTTILVIEDYTENLKEAKANAEFIVRSVNNYDSMMDALSQCHNLFEAEYQDLSDQGKRVRQSVIAAILKATRQ